MQASLLQELVRISESRLTFDPKSTFAVFLQLRPEAGFSKRLKPDVHFGRLLSQPEHLTEMVDVRAMKTGLNRFFLSAGLEFAGLSHGT